MQKYLLSIYQPNIETEGEIPPPEVLDPIMENLAAFRRELVEADAWVFSGGLHGPSASTVLQLRDGEMVTTDGPYAESKEYVGGFTIIQAPDLDAALAWGRKMADAIKLLPIEVRPFEDEDATPSCE